MTQRNPAVMGKDRRRNAELIVGCGLFLVLGLTAWTYWSGLSGPLILDDHANLAPLLDIGRGNLSWSEFISGNRSGPLGRPISMLSFLLNYLLTGDSVAPMKATNLAIHLICGTLLFWLAGRLFTQHPETSSRRWHLALVVTALWLLSPLFVGTVLYLVQRMAQLAAMFMLAGLLLYVVGRQSLLMRSKTGWFPIGLSLAVCWPLATFSKENGAVLPLLLLVTELFWFRFDGEPGTVRTLKTLFWITIGLPAFVLAVIALTMPDALFGGYLGRDFTLPERLLSELRALGRYVAVLLFPRGATMGVYHDDFVVSRGLFSPPSTFAAAVVWISVGVAAFRWRNYRLGLILYGIIFFLAGQIVESSIFPLELYFDHRNYLPGIGVYLTCAIGAAVALERGRVVSRTAIKLLAVAVPLLFAAASYQRVQAWRTWGSLALTSVAAHPNSARAHVALANVYTEHDDASNAFAELRAVERLSGSALSGVALHRLYVHCATHTPISAETRALIAKVRVLSINSYTEYSLASIAGVAADEACAMQLKSVSLGRMLNSWYRHSDVFGNKVMLYDMHCSLAKILMALGYAPAAYAHLDDAMALMPHNLVAGLLMLHYYLDRHNGNSALSLASYLMKQDRGAFEGDSRNLRELYAWLVREKKRAEARQTGPNTDHSLR